MGIESWREEFYPETGEASAKRGTLAAIEHGIRKWEGVRDENLKKHGLHRYRTGIFDEDGREMMRLGWEECGLCWIYQCEEGPKGKDLGCKGCPLVGVDENGIDIVCGGEGHGYWLVSQNRAGPEILIGELKQAREEWVKKYGERVEEGNKYGG